MNDDSAAGQDPRSAGTLVEAAGCSLGAFGLYTETVDTLIEAVDN